MISKMLYNAYAILQLNYFTKISLLLGFYFQLSIEFTYVVPYLPFMFIFELKITLLFHFCVFFIIEFVILQMQKLAKISSCCLWSTSKANERGNRRAPSIVCTCYGEDSKNGPAFRRVRSNR